MQLCVDPFSTRQSVVSTGYHHITFALCHITDYDLHTTIPAGSGEEYFNHGPAGGAGPNIPVAVSVTGVQLSTEAETVMNAEQS